MEENWKTIPGFENRYEASNLGRIRSLFTGKILKPHYFNGKYATYHFYGAGAVPNRSMRGYKAVYLAFIGPIPPNHEIDHIDDNTKNDRLDNLQALTRQENMAKSWRLRRATGYRARNAHSKPRESA